MKKFATVAFLGLTATAVAAPAFAGGPVVAAAEPTVAAPTVAPMPAPGMDWSGFYAGGQLGFGNVGSTDPFEGEGLLGGVHAGYRMDWGSFVAGAELAFDLASIDLGDVSITTIDSIGRLGLTGGVDLGRALVYGTVGLARIGGDVDQDGNYYGLGMDYALSDRMTVGGQVLKHEFDEVPAGSLDTTLVQARVSFQF
jgi:opacity protein-like surface antigen